jgi:RraA family protein
MEGCRLPSQSSSACLGSSVDKPKQSSQGMFFCRDLGGKMRFSGKISTVKCFENNPLVRKALEEDGQGRVLVVDGGGSMRCALLGDNIAEMAYKNGWDVSDCLFYHAWHA